VVSGSIRVSVDRERCCGAGLCASIAPEVFDQSREDGIVVLLQETPAVAVLPLVEEAAGLCPVAAIGLSL